MKAIWKGAISFGLVNIPVALYPATRSSEKIKFRMLRDSDQSPIKYKRVAETDEKEVPYEHIVKGFEYEKGNFVVLTDEDFEKVDIKSNQLVEITEFVDLAEIDPMFFDTPYFLAPEKGGDKAYALLREALARSGKVGLAKVTIKAREHLAAVKPLGKALVLELMHFPEELAQPDELPLPKSDAPAKELKMAESLIDSMSGKWEPGSFKDEYHAALMKLIKRKISAGGKSVSTHKTKPVKATNVVDLTSVLQQSLDAVGRKEKSKAGASAAHKKHRKAA
jgi:DNA end-binding protein Ku